MSQFLSELCEKLVDPYANDGTGMWGLTEEFQYYSSSLKRTVVVPRGFVYDHASVPRIPLIYDQFGNRYHRPALVHDYLCREGHVKRNRADRVFLEAMRLQNAEELSEMHAQGVDEETIAERARALEGRAQLMFAGVVLYSKSGIWKRDVDQPGFEAVA